MAETIAPEAVEARWRALAIRWLPASALIVLGLAVYLETRLWLVAKFPYFTDEGILANFAQIGLDANQRLQSLNDGIRPGLVWLTMVGMRLHFGPLVSIRLVIVAFGLIALVAGAVLLWRWVGRVAASTFVVLAIFIPFLFLYDALGLRDPAIAALMVAAFLLEIELARNPRLAIGVLLGVDFALVILIKDSGKTAYYLLPLSLVYFPFRSPDRVRLAARWLGNVFVAVIITLLATVPMRLTVAYKNLAITQRAYGVMHSFSYARSHSITLFNQAWPSVRGDLTSYLTYPVVALALIGLILGLRRRPRFTVLVAIWAIVQVGSVIWIAVLAYPRYLTPAVPFFLILAAIGVDELVRIARARVELTRPVLAGGAVLAILLLAPAIAFDARLSYDVPSAPMPYLDKAQYVLGYTSGIGLEPALHELQALSSTGPITVIWNPNGRNDVLTLLIGLQAPKVTLVSTGDPGAKTAQYVLTNGLPLPAGVGPVHVVWTYRRPDHGSPIVIYRRS